MARSFQTGAKHIIQANRSTSYCRTERIIEVEKKCIKCNGNMQKALLSSNAAFCPQTTRKGANPKLCNVDVYVCPECGYVDFYAEKPEIFKGK